jgi:hypothetical protein
MCSKLWCWWFEFSSDGCAFWGLGWRWCGGGEREGEREDMVTNMQIMHYA